MLRSAMTPHVIVPPEVERVATVVVDAGLKVHKELGAGLLESAYEHCFAHELTKRGHDVKRQVPQPLLYDGTKLDVGYRIDMLVDSVVILEVKSVDALTEIHQSQVLTYMRLSACHVGFLINFNVPLFKTGLPRFIM
jgi:GxxExxY protein